MHVFLTTLRGCANLKWSSIHSPRGCKTLAVAFLRWETDRQATSFTYNKNGHKECTKRCHFAGGSFQVRWNGADFCHVLLWMHSAAHNHSASGKVNTKTCFVHQTLRIFLNLTSLQDYPRQIQAFGNVVYPLFALMIGTRSSTDVSFVRLNQPADSSRNSSNIHINASILADVGKCTGCDIDMGSLFRYAPKFLGSIKLHCKFRSYGKFMESFSGLVGYWADTLTVYKENTLLRILLKS